jgi:hypothetical protein
MLQHTNTSLSSLPISQPSSVPFSISIAVPYQGPRHSATPPIFFHSPLRVNPTTPDSLSRIWQYQSLRWSNITTAQCSTHKHKPCPSGKHFSRIAGTTSVPNIHPSLLVFRNSVQVALTLFEESQGANFPASAVSHQACCTFEAHLSAYCRPASTSRA